MHPADLCYHCEILKTNVNVFTRYRVRIQIAHVLHRSRYIEHIKLILDEESISTVPSRHMLHMYNYCTVKNILKTIL